MCLCACCFNHVQLFATLWTVDCQAPLSMKFSRQEYWSELPCPPRPNRGIKPLSLMSPAFAERFKSFPGSSDCKASACNAGDLGSIPGSKRLPGEGNGNPLQYSCLENFMDRET